MRHVTGVSGADAPNDRHRGGACPESPGLPAGTEEKRGIVGLRRIGSWAMQASRSRRGFLVLSWKTGRIIILWPLIQGRDASGHAGPAIVACLTACLEDWG